MATNDRGDGAGSLSTALGLALALAVGAAAFVAVLEWAAVLVLAPRRELVGPLPVEVPVAALGERAVTHTLAYVALLVVVALLRHALVRRPRPSPLPLLAATLALFVGAVVGPLALELAGATATALVWGVRAFAAGVAVLIYGGLRRWPIPPRLVLALALPPLGLVVFTGIVFASSPFADPGGHRVASGDAPAERTPASRPNVLIVVLDTVRADRMSLYGWPRPTTPVLDALAARAIVFDRAIADGTWTVPSHASLFTGAPVRRHGAGLEAARLDGALPTLAEQLGAAGYDTATFSNNSLISARTGLDRGFARSQALSGVRAFSQSTLERWVRQLGVRPPLPWLEPDDGAALTNSLVARWLDERGTSDAPFFLFVNYLEAHLPWRVPIAFRRAVMDEEQVARSYALPAEAGGDLLDLVQGRVMREGPGVVSAADAEVLALQYEAAIAYLDHRAGELIGLLEARALLDETLVVVTSDHGEYLGTREMWSHLIGAFNDLTHVPLLVREPGRASGLRVAAPVQLRDVHATVLAATGVPAQTPGRFGSRDLVALAAAPPSGRIAVSQVGNTGAGGPLTQQRKKARRQLARFAAPVTTAQDERFKYEEWRSGARRLYDLESDPGETFDVARHHEDELRRMAKRLRAFRDATPAHDPSASPAPSEDATELLRELGYIED